MGLEILAAAAISAAISAGSYAISYLTAPHNNQTLDNARNIDPRIQGSRYGSFIPRTYGTVEMAGQVIWASTILDTPTTTPPTRTKGGGTPGQTTHHYTRSFAVLFCTGPVAGITRITADDKTFYQSATLGEVVTDKLHIYTGTEEQDPNSWIEADKGVGRVSAHRGYVVVVFKDFPIDQYGDRIPNMRAEIVQSEDTTLEDVVTAECALAGLTGADIATSALAEISVDGYFVNQQGNIRSSLEQLSKAFQFYGAEYDGRVSFNTLPQAPKAVVPWEDLGCIEDEDSVDEDEPPPRISIKRRQSVEIPKSVSVVYYDKARAYEEGTQSYTRQNLLSRETASHGFNLVMTPNFASRLAKIIAIRGWAERLPVEFSLPPDYFVYAAGDVLSVPESEGGELIDVRIEKMSFSAPGVVRVQGVQQFAEVYEQTGDGGTAGETPPDVPPVEDPCDTEVWMDDRSPFRDYEQGIAGHYVAVRPRLCNPTAGIWTGTSILRNVDGEGDYRQHAIITEAATMGTLLADLDAHAHGLDTTNTIQVHLDSGSVSSITDEAFNADQTLNLFAVGTETLQARDVTDLGGGDYELSHLRRALFDTDSSGTQTAGASVVLLDSRVKRVTHNLNEVGQEYEFVGVSFGRKIEEATPFNFTYGARGVEPGGDVPSAPVAPAVADVNGSPVLRWDTPAENNRTIQRYKVSVYTDAGMTTILDDYEDVEVAGNQFTLPVDSIGTEYYYKVEAENALGTGPAASGSFIPAAATAGAHASTHYADGTDPLTGDLDANARVAVRKNSAGATSTRRRVNLIEGSNITITVADDAGAEEVDVQIDATVPDASIYAYRTIAANATAAAGDQVIFIDVTSGAVTLALLTAVGRGGKWYSVKVIGSGTNLATIDPNGSETFDGNATVQLAVGDRLRFMSDNSNWQSIA